MSQYLVGQCFELGEGVEISDADAIKWCAFHVLRYHGFRVLIRHACRYRLSAEHGYAPAMVSLSFLESEDSLRCVKCIKRTDFQFCN